VLEGGGAGKVIRSILNKEDQSGMTIGFHQQTNM